MQSHPKGFRIIIASAIILCIIIAIIVVQIPDPAKPRMIKFSGYDWWVKSSNGVVAGPGPNIFSDSGDNVKVDEQGRLHLKITRTGDHWECAEVVSNKSFGYGEYAFTLASDPESLDPEVVLGLFTWDDHPDYSNREIDVEFSRWQDQENSNAQYVVQPWNIPENIHRFDVRSNGSLSTHSFEWRPDGVSFRSYFGPYAASPNQDDLIQTWDYSGNKTPLPGNENARINLWLIGGSPPLNEQECEIIIDGFTFIRSS